MNEQLAQKAVSATRLFKALWNEATEVLAMQDADGGQGFATAAEMAAELGLRMDGIREAADLDGIKIPADPADWRLWGFFPDAECDWSGSDRT